MLFPLILIHISVLLCSFECALNENLKYFETIHASSLQHHIVKRGATLSAHPFNTIKELHFKTLGKNFRLILHPHSSVLHSNFKAYSVDGDGKETTVHVDRENFYTGRVFGEKASDVKLHMEDGVVTGIIHTPHETYHIEGAVEQADHLMVNDYRRPWTPATPEELQVRCRPLSSSVKKCTIKMCSKGLNANFKENKPTEP